VKAFGSRTGVSRLTSREAGQSRDGSHADSAVVSVVEGIRRLCPSDPWDQVGSATASVEVSVAVVSGVVVLGEIETVDSEAAATSVVVEAASAEVVVLEVTAVAIVGSATVVASAVVGRTATLRQTPPTAPAADSVVHVVAVTGETSPARPVGTAGTVVVAHMMTDRAVTEDTAAAEIAAIATLGKQAATRNLFGHAATMVGSATETTTDLETTTHASAPTKVVATKIRESYDATNRTIIMLSCGGYFRPFSSPYPSLLLDLLNFRPLWG
jgi:hypothetical protein